MKQIELPPTLNNNWLHTEITDNIKDTIREFFEDHEYHGFLERVWFEMIEEQNPELYQKFVDLEENPPCLGSDLWWYEENLGKPPGFEIYIFSLVQCMIEENRFPEHIRWNDPKKKHLGQYWINPYEINYHEKTTYTKQELQDHYKNYDKNQQDIKDQINNLPITQELQESLKQTLILYELWEKTIETTKQIKVYNNIIEAFEQETIRNIVLDTIQQPRDVSTPIPRYDEDFFCIHLP